MGSKPWHHDGKSRHQRGYGSEWDKTRQVILIRDNHLCQECLRHDRVTPAKHVDHIIPKARNGTDDPENLQALCKPCHEAKTKAERNTNNGKRTVPWTGIGIDGWPTG